MYLMRRRTKSQFCHPTRVLILCHTLRVSHILTRYILYRDKANCPRNSKLALHAISCTRRGELQFAISINQSHTGWHRLALKSSAVLLG